MGCYNDPIIFFSGWIVQVWLKVQGHDGIKSSKKIRTLMTEGEGLDNICREKQWTKTNTYICAMHHVNYQQGNTIMGSTGTGIVLLLHFLICV
jgi:hypothetical protein